MTWRQALHTMIVLAAFAAILGSSACNRPTEEDCRAALTNIRRILGTENNDFGKSPEVALRACRGNGRKESVACAIRAKTVDDLKACQGPLAQQADTPQESEVKATEKAPE